MAELYVRSGESSEILMYSEGVEGKENKELEEGEKRCREGRMWRRWHMMIR